MKKLFVILVVSAICCAFLSLSGFVVEATTLTFDEAYESNKPIQTNGIMSLEEDSKFEHNKEIELNFEIKGSSEQISEFLVTAESDEKVSIYSIEKSISSNVFTLRFVVVGEGTHTIQLLVSSNTYFAKSFIYIFSTEMYDYISNVSLSEAKRGYFRHMLGLGRVKEDDYNNIVYGSDFANITNTMYNGEESTAYNYEELSENGNISIWGTITYSDTYGTAHPAKGVHVVVYDVDAFGIKYPIASAYTNVQGQYGFVLENDMSIIENGYDIFVKILFANGDVQVQDSFAIYSVNFADDPVINVQNGFCLQSNWDFTPENDLGCALYLFQASLMGFEYLGYLDPDYDTIYLGIEFPYDNGVVSWYLPGQIPNIYIAGNYLTHYSWDILLHEFGHYVADQYNLSKLIGADHNFESDLISTINFETGTKVAWSEGWATYFDISCQLHMQYTIYPSIPFVGDAYYKHYGVETVYINPTNPGFSYLMGEGNEYVIAMLLFDIADDPGSTEVFDNVAWGHDTLFDYLCIVSQNHPDECISGFMDFYQSLSLSACDDGITKMLPYYMISVELIIGNLSYSPPTFSWSAQAGTSTFMTNEYVLYIMDSSMTVIFYKNVDEALICVLSESDWNDVFSYNSPYIYWNVSARHFHINYTTEAYFSNRVLKNMPTQVLLHEYQNLSGRLRLPGNFIWYKYTAEYTGMYCFFTTGTTDTYGEFFYSPVANHSSEGMFAFDNDSYDGVNFSEWILIETGDTIYLRLRGDDWTATGNFVISVYGNPI